MNAPEYSIVIPVFNNQATVEKLFTELESFFRRMETSFEIIFVDDCSADESLNILRKLQAANPDNVGVIPLAENIGQHPATLEGLKPVRGKFIITMDADLQVQAEEIRKLIDKQLSGDADLVTGFFEADYPGLRRKIGSWIIDWLMIYGLKLGLEKGQKGSSFRLIKNELIQIILATHDPVYFLDVVLLRKAKCARFVNVSRQSQPHEGSGYTFFALSSMTVNLVAHYGRSSLKLIISTSFILLLAFSIYFFSITIKSYNSYGIITKLAVIAVYLLSFLLLLPGVYLFAAICKSLLNRNPQHALNQNL